MVGRWVIMSVVLAAAAAGCGPSFPPELMKEVEREVAFQDLLRAPEAHRHTTVVLGGTIVTAEVHEKETRLVVARHPLDYRKRPVTGDAAHGRFVVRAEEFLDPVIYDSGRKVTVVGTVTGESMTTSSGGKPWPVIRKRALHLWPKSYPSRTEVGATIGVGIYWGF